MVYLNIAHGVKINSAQIVEKMRGQGILVDAEDARRFRLVTHYSVDDIAVERVITAFREALVN
jgi:hypothetical protein